MKDIGRLEKYKDRMEQIQDIAKMNHNSVSYRVLVDILKDTNSKILQEDIDAVIEKMTSKEIEVVMAEEDEGYDDQNSTDSQQFIPADVNITPRNITVDFIVDRLKHGEINLNPDFQRRGGLWSKKQRSQLIESLMLKIPLPTFTLMLPMRINGLLLTDYRD